MTVSNTSRKRAIKTYRERLATRGMARFEVLGLDGDRDLIRSLDQEGLHSGGVAPLAAGRRRSRLGPKPACRPQGRTVTRYLLDTNIISNVTRPAPSEPLMAWMAEQADDSLFISSLAIAEIRRGILEKPAGRKRDQLEAWFSGPDGPPALFAGRVLGFDEKAALAWARLMAEGTATGRSRDALDTIIAAVAEANGCVVVTDNESHFAGVDAVNPMRGG